MDYFPESGCSSIGGGGGPELESSTTISVETSDDDSPDCGQGGEGTESMNVDITSASVPIGDGHGVGTIIEGPC